MVEQAGFERAAQVLGAVAVGGVAAHQAAGGAGLASRCCARHAAARPTEIGQRLLNHVQQVRLLEARPADQVPALDEEGLPERLRIALNADSLATWWAQAVGDFCAVQRLLLDLVVEDQTVGLKRMRAR